MEFPIANFIFGSFVLFPKCCAVGHVKMGKPIILESETKKCNLFLWFQVDYVIIFIGKHDHALIDLAIFHFTAVFRRQLS